MRIVVIGGSGHIGTFLIPRLVRAGHEVINISRGRRASYVDDPIWQQVQNVVADRVAEDAEGTFPGRVADLKADVVVDLVCFTLESAQALVDRLRGETGHLVHCGTLWRYGPALKVPIHEGQGTPPFDEYGIEKEAIAQMLKAETAAGGLVTTSLHPGHIVGPGWSPTGPLGNNDPAVWATISAGQPLKVPGSGAELMHHVHADDVAQIFELAIQHRDAAGGEDFHAVGPSALSVRGYAEIVAGWFGQELTLATVTWEEFRQTTTPEFAENSWGHLHRSHYLSIDKPKRLLGFAPQWEPEDAVLESVRWLIDNHQLDVANPLTV
jgi:nucleoside-diphosphate-sugar epimerase